MDGTDRTKAYEGLARPLRFVVLALILCYAALVWANDISVEDAKLQPADGGGYSLAADFDLSLSRRLEKVLSEGVPLYFNIDFECYRPRWYWFDHSVVKKTYQLRLSFHALTRTYRLSSGGLHQSFSSVEEVVRALGTVRGWHVIERDELEPGTSYEVAVRMVLDVDRLPKPFQVSALTNPDWTLASDWVRWGFATDSDGNIVQ